MVTKKGYLDYWNALIRLQLALFHFYIQFYKILNIHGIYMLFLENVAVGSLDEIQSMVDGFFYFSRHGLYG